MAKHSIMVVTVLRSILRLLQHFERANKNWVHESSYSKWIWQNQAESTLYLARRTPFTCFKTMIWKFIIKRLYKFLLLWFAYSTYNKRLCMTTAANLREYAGKKKLGSALGWSAPPSRQKASSTGKLNHWNVGLSRGGSIQLSHYTCKTKSVNRQLADRTEYVEYNRFVFSITSGHPHLDKHHVFSLVNDQTAINESTTDKASYWSWASATFALSLELPEGPRWAQGLQDSELDFDLSELCLQD